MNPIKIGTRTSPLALWQANQVKSLLAEKNITSELVLINSSGDLDLSRPLDQIGIVGVFTKQLDQALEAGVVDIAVHSMKDVPTKRPAQIVQAAVLKRGNSDDLLLIKQGIIDPNLDLISSLQQQKLVVATGGIRRRGLWQHYFPQHSLQPLRGNIKTRIDSLQNPDIDAIIIAAAALERLEIKEIPGLEIHPLTWITPAPAQGAVVVECLEESPYLNLISSLNHPISDLTTSAERNFLALLEGGCTSPIAAHCSVTTVEKTDASQLVKLNLLAQVVSRNGEHFYQLQRSMECNIESTDLSSAKQQLFSQVASFVDQFVKIGAKKMLLEDK